MHFRGIAHDSRMHRVLYCFRFRRIHTAATAAAANTATTASSHPHGNEAGSVALATVVVTPVVLVSVVGRVLLLCVVATVVTAAPVVTFADGFFTVVAAEVVSVGFVVAVALVVVADGTFGFSPPCCQMRT